MLGFLHELEQFRQNATYTDFPKLRKKAYVVLKKRYLAARKKQRKELQEVLKLLSENFDFNVNLLKGLGGIPEKYTAYQKAVLKEIFNEDM